MGIYKKRSFFVNEKSDAKIVKNQSKTFTKSRIKINSQKSITTQVFLLNTKDKKEGKLCL